MPDIKIPYGRAFLTGNVNENNFTGIFHSSLPAGNRDGNALVKEALDNPVNSPGLEKLASQAAKAVIISSDHTRPVPSRIIMPQILQRLRQGNPDIDITILIATGCHRQTTREELTGKFGEQIVKQEKIVIHDSFDDSSLVKIGILPSGGDLIINKLAVECDLLIAEGFIEPHFFAGFSGGRKSVLPGIASRLTVMANHCAEFISNPCARTGILENNPIHEDMVYAAKAANLAFIVNVVIDHDKKITTAFAGDPFDAHRKGTDFLEQFAGIEVPESDIVITGNGGYPLDQNVYQSVKGMTAGEAACREGGVIIICTACNDGHGGESFYRNLSASSPEQILENVKKIPRDQTIPDQWQYQILARIMAKHQVIVVTTDCSHSMLRDMGLVPASSIDEALKLAYAVCGNDAKVSVIPDGVSVIVKKR